MKINHARLYNRKNKLRRLFIAGGIILLAGFTLHTGRVSAAIWLSAAIEGRPTFHLHRTGANPCDQLSLPRRSRPA